MKTDMTSRERIIATVERQPTDHIPLCFDAICHGWVQFLSKLHPDPFDMALHYANLGVDTGIQLQYFYSMSRESVETKEWTETFTNRNPLMYKEYITPKGSLRQVIRKTDDYQCDSIDLFDDFHVPSGRSVKYLVDCEEELDRLRYILKAPGRAEFEQFRESAAEARKFCDKQQILLTGSLAGIGDPLMWLSGVEKVLFAAMDTPDFLHTYIEIISAWNMAHMKILLDAGVDMIARRGWYECTDFWSPALYKEFLFEPLKKEINLAHQAGAKYVYIMNSGAMPLLGYFRELGIDILSNVEPEKNDLAAVKRAIGDKITLCTGVNNYHILEAGTEAEVKQAVGAAVETLSPGGGFILSPSDSILDTSEIAKRNFFEMIAAWKAIA